MFSSLEPDPLAWSQPADTEEFAWTVFYVHISWEIKFLWAIFEYGVIALEPDAMELSLECIKEQHT